MSRGGSQNRGKPYSKRPPTMQRSNSKTTYRQNSNEGWGQKFWTLEESGVSFPTWLQQEHPNKDPAQRFTYSKYMPVMPEQADCCKDDRCIEYDEQSDKTYVKFGYCQKCRYNNIQYMNDYYKFFKAAQNVPKTPAS
jgi:hypothetical protein